MTNKKRLVRMALVFAITIAIFGFASLSLAPHAQAASLSPQRLEMPHTPQAPHVASACSHLVAQKEIYNTVTGYNVGHLWLYYNQPPCNTWQGLIQRYGGDGPGYATINLCNSNTCSYGSRYSGGLSILLYSGTLSGHDTVCVVGQVEASNHKGEGQDEICQTH